MSGWLSDLASLVPPIGVGVLFWVVVRALLNADRAERRATSDLDRQDRETPRS